MVVPGLPEKEVDVLCHSFILEQKVIVPHESMPYLWKTVCTVDCTVLRVRVHGLSCMCVFHLVGIPHVWSA